MLDPSDDFRRAISVFAGGFSFTRSLTHPYLVAPVHDRVLILRDGPRRSGDYRSEEVVAWDIPVAELAEISEKETRNRYRICYLLPDGESDATMRKEFKSRGCRLMGTEELFQHRLTGLAASEPPYPIVRVVSEEQAAVLGKAIRRRVTYLSHLTAEPPRMRQYMAVNDEGNPVGWVASVVVGDATWVSSMYVAPEYRRRGIARSLMLRMLTDDRDAGATASILLASHAGSHLYPTVGYETLGTLYVFVPPR